MVNIVNVKSGSLEGFGLNIGFIEHLHDSELRAITASSLISTLQKSLYAKSPSAC
jgi:hypothetical protein